MRSVKNEEWGVRNEELWYRLAAIYFFHSKRALHVSCVRSARFACMRKLPIYAPFCMFGTLARMKPPVYFLLYIISTPCISLYKLSIMYIYNKVCKCACMCAKCAYRWIFAQKLPWYFMQTDKIAVSKLFITLYWCFKSKKAVAFWWNLWYNYLCLF